MPLLDISELYATNSGFMLVLLLVLVAVAIWVYLDLRKRRLEREKMFSDDDMAEDSNGEEEDEEDEEDDDATGANGTDEEEEGVYPVAPSSDPGSRKASLQVHSAYTERLPRDAPYGGLTPDYRPPNSFAGSNGGWPQRGTSVSTQTRPVMEDRGTAVFPSGSFTSTLGETDDMEAGSVGGADGGAGAGRSRRQTNATHPQGSGGGRGSGSSGDMGGDVPAYYDDSSSESEYRQGGNGAAGMRAGAGTGAEPWSPDTTPAVSPTGLVGGVGHRVLRHTKMDMDDSEASVVVVRTSQSSISVASDDTWANVRDTDPDNEDII